MKWCSLYIRSEDSSSVAQVLLNSLEALGYKAYDPFPGGFGTPPELKTFVKHFVAPAQGGWVRILGEPDERVIEGISQKYPLLHAWINDTDGNIDAYNNGKDDEEGLTRYLLANKSIEDLHKAQAGLLPTILEKPANPDTPNLALPAEIAQMMNEHNIKPEQAGSMISRLTSQLFSKMDKSSDGEAGRMREQAQSMLIKSQGVDWNTPAGQRLRAISNVISLPSNWRAPDFDVVRDAYQVARRLQRNANAYLMPDEDTAIQALPDAIYYQPVYVGK